MKKTERKALGLKLLIAIKKVLTDNEGELKNKTEKAIQKSIKQIVRRTDKNANGCYAGKNKQLQFNTDNMPADAVGIVL